LCSLIIVIIILQIFVEILKIILIFCRKIKRGKTRAKRRRKSAQSCSYGSYPCGNSCMHAIYCSAYFLDHYWHASRCTCTRIKQNPTCYLGWLFCRAFSQIVWHMCHVFVLHFYILYIERVGFNLHTVDHVSCICKCQFSCTGSSSLDQTIKIRANLANAFC
jgi:hypothetical protein